MAGLLLRGAIWYHGRSWKHLQRLVREPERAQRDVLRRLLHANHATRFGAEHGFIGVRQPGDYQARVPVQEFEQLRPYVEEQRKTGATSLTKEPPRFYVQTSGTTGQPKLIPVTASMLAMHRSEQGLFTYLQYRACPEAFDGKAFGIMGAAVEGTLDTGHTVGSVSGHLYQSLPKPLQARFVVPPEVSRIADYAVKYLVIVRLALAEPEITYLGSPNPSTFLRLLDVIRDERDLLVDSLRSGRLEALSGLEPSIREPLARRIRPAADRAGMLQRVGDPSFAGLWPKIRLVTTWTGGSCGIALDALRARLPAAAKVMELGYQASEGRGTLALVPESPAGIPPLHHHFFEFVEPERWLSGRPEFLTLDQLVNGQRYYILFSTAAGLYRYFMNDIVEVTGFFERTPLLRFVQKGKGVTSLTGEKLYEAQAIEAVKASANRLTFSSSFFLVVAEERSSAYTVLIELEDGARPDAAAAAATVDQHLSTLNIEYHSKRQSGRLAPPTVTWLRRGAGEAYKAACVKAGQREGQFKPMILQYRKDLLLDFDEYASR
jgi:hypothetical protein